MNSSSSSSKSDARSTSTSKLGPGGAEDRVGPPSTSFSSSSLTSSGCGRSVRVQMGGAPKRPAYNLNWIVVF